MRFLSCNPRRNNSLACLLRTRVTHNSGTSPKPSTMPYKRKAKGAAGGAKNRTKKSKLAADLGEGDTSSFISGEANDVIEPPQWLLHHCLTKSTDWKNRLESLVLRSVQQSDTKVGYEQECITSPSTDESHLHEMDAILFEPFKNLLITNQSSKSKRKPYEGDRSNMHFVKSAIRVELYSESLWRYGAQFLQAVVEHFARTVEADLIILTPDDRTDLHENGSEAREARPGPSAPSRSKASQKAPASQYGASTCRQNQTDYQPIPLHPNHTAPLTTQEPSKQIVPIIISTLAQLRATRKPEHDESTQQSKPLTIMYLGDYNDGPDMKLLHHLHVAIRSSLWCSEVLIMYSPRNIASYGITCATETRRIEHVADLEAMTLSVAPWRSKPQALKLRAGLEDKIYARNVRYIQRCLRHRAPEQDGSSLTIPYSDWGFLRGSQTGKMFREVDLDLNDAEDILSMVGLSNDDTKIKAALIGFGSRENALQVWEASDPYYGTGAFAEAALSAEGYTTSDRWSDFPTNLQDVINKLERKECHSSNAPYYWEQMFLSLVVRPKEVRAGWSDIAIDPLTQGWVSRILRQHKDCSSSNKAYGILEQGHVGGALIYGPPGTGKTHLARVLARESKTAVICASAADIENKWVGETPKAIKGLFNLGRMLAPSIIFIDEADSLSRLRRSDAMHHERAQFNELLAEMDGLSKSKTTPFVLLSTNFPGDLDSAVLRRVPNLLYMGLPSTTMRAKIFQIFLQGEILSEDVQYDTLAHLTSGYSGSDIRNLCLQAAMMCARLVERGSNQGKRLLKYALFEQALSMARPTVNKAALPSIKNFARENDPLALERLKADEIDNMDHRLKKVMRDVTENRRAKEIDESSSHDLPPPKSSLTTVKISLDHPSSDADRCMSLQSPISVLPFDHKPRLMDKIHAISHLSEVNDRTSSASGGLYDNLGVNGNQSTDLYRPLKDSNIRMLTILPQTVGNIPGSPLTCTLEEVGMDAWTSEYRSFRENLPTIEGSSYLDEGRLRRALWEIFKNAQWLLKSGHMDRPLECLYGVADRYHWGDFVALSYVWGNQCHKRDITINGEPFQVGQNLHDALVRLQESFEVKERKLRVWVDAIYIYSDRTSIKRYRTLR
ncbi:hypothetical protein BDV96DRAFT_686817, partial [Lophiotrema nucula]